MRQLVLVLAACSIGCHMPASTTLVPQPQRLTGISTIYVDNLGTDDGADLVREKIRIELMQSDRFRLVEDPDGADAVLRGSAGVATPQRQGTTRYVGSGVLRLVDRATNEPIWIFEYKPSWGGPSSASTKVAREVVMMLIRDAGPASIDQP